MNTLIGQIRSRTGEDLLKMFDVTVSSDTQSFPMDSNCQFEIALITSGNGSYQIGNTVHPINPGDFFVFFNNEPRSIASITTDSLSFLTLHFEPRFLFSSTLVTALSVTSALSPQATSTPRHKSSANTVHTIDNVLFITSSVYGNLFVIDSGNARRDQAGDLVSN